MSGGNRVFGLGQVGFLRLRVSEVVEAVEPSHFQAGYAARIEGVDCQACPWSAFSAQGRLWLAGWSQADNEGNNPEVLP